MRESIGLPDEVEVLASHSSRHSEAGYSSIGDVVVWNDGGITCAGQVVAHCAAEGVPITLLKHLDAVAYDAAHSVMTARIIDEYGWTDTENILDSCTWCDYSANHIKILVPRDV